MSANARLREFMAARGLTQRELAVTVGVSAKYVSQLCSNRPVSDQFIGRLARTFGGAAAAAVAGGELPAKVALRCGAPDVATGIAFPPIECYREVPRPGLYERHLFDELLFDATVARRIPSARLRWTVDELLQEALVACGVLKGHCPHASVAAPVRYQTPVERWFTPRGETCVAYGADDVADADAEG